MGFPDAYSIEAWVKTTNGGGVLYRWRPYGTGFYTYGWDLYYNGGANAGVYSPTVPNDGNWHHVAGVRTSAPSKMQFYIDGVLKGENLISTGYLSNYYYPFNYSAAIGRDGDVCNGVVASYQGKVAGFALFDRALTALRFCLTQRFLPLRPDSQRNRPSSALCYRF